MLAVKRNRIEFIDIAKCIAIIMVVLGHTATNDELLSSNLDLIYRILYSIHMPLFFFLTGMSIRPKRLQFLKAWKDFLHKMILTIVIPYLVWALIYCQFSIDNTGRILYGSWEMLGKAGSMTSLWYLSCLFIARIMTAGIITMKEHFHVGGIKALLVPSALCMIIGVVLPKIEIGYPWELQVAFVATGFILLGIIFRIDIIELSVQKGWVLFSLLLGSVLFYALTLLLRKDGFPIMLMCKGSYGSLFPALACAVFGGFAVLIVSMLLKRMADEWLPMADLKPLVYLGQNTIGVFLLHKVMLQSFFIPFLESAMTSTPMVLVRCIAAVIAILVSIVLCWVIELYIPELMGVFSKERLMPEKTNDSHGSDARLQP